MKIVEMIKNMFAVVRDTDRKFQERVFTMLTWFVVPAVIVALIGDLIIKENIHEILLLAGVILFVPVITTICLYKNRINIAIRIIIIGLLFLILPILFFFGGGAEGGGVMWFIFAFLYIGLVLSGRWRTIFLIVIGVMAFACYQIERFFPQYVVSHSKEVFYADSFLSLILVGLVCFGMVMFQNRIYQEENEKAKKETERAEELNRAQNRFFSSMSHEIRTPINSILGLNELILRETDVSDEIAKDAEGIQGAGKMLLALINDILDFSKIEAGSMDIVPVEYQVGNLMSEIVNMIWLKAQEKGLKLEVSVDPQVPSRLYGDEVRIKQILINLLNNAVKYTKEGSVGLHIESTKVSEETVLLRISVTDTGMGIQKESLPYLFDAFKRVDEKKNRYIEGTGLGLSIVKMLVELMDGTITVDSIYGEGSTFTVTLEQKVVDGAEIGELRIHNYGKAKKHAYESSFTAPEAKILIVDDNEMNLAVEKKLLSGTKMQVDTVLSGKAALRQTLRERYDVILMDHLMPEMDGIECLHELRNQEGSLNRLVSVVVLTANAGSENRKLYHLAGFDGYLVKPVSGAALEDMLLKYIPEEKLHIEGRVQKMSGDISTYAGYARKEHVVISCTSMCDLPDAMARELGIPIIPFHIRTEHGNFKDGIQMGADELIRYMDVGEDAISSPPEVSEYTEFFAELLKTSHHLIHIAITTSMSEDYYRASEAAEAFENVTVINSESLSSATGLLVLIAYKLSRQDLSVYELVQELEVVKKRLQCSFILDSTEYMARKGLISRKVNRVTEALGIHVSLVIRKDKAGIGGIWQGNVKYAYKRYIRKAFSGNVTPDPELVFVTYADISEEMLLWIKEEIGKVAHFEHIIFKQASAAISSNCGPGTFGILYFEKGEKSYHLGSFLEKEEEAPDEEEADGYAASGQKNEREPQEVVPDGNASAGPVEEKEDGKDIEIEKEKEEIKEPAPLEPKWYDGLEGIDGKAAVQNCGSEDSFQTVVKIFYDSIGVKSKELEEFFDTEDWKNYTIKVHALKSSAKLVGALEFSEKAFALEMAGKEENISYIREHHPDFMEQYKSFEKILRVVCGTSEAEEDAVQTEKPTADRYLLEAFYEAVEEGAREADYDIIEEAFGEVDAYDIPEPDGSIIRSIKEKADGFDYEGILEILEQKDV